MEWKNYSEKIVLAHRVKLEGWPTDSPIENNIDNLARKTLQSISCMVRSGEIFWVEISLEEAREITGRAHPRPERAVRVDKNKTRGPYRKRKLPSEDVIEDMDEDEDEEHDDDYVDVDDDDDDDGIESQPRISPLSNKATQSQRPAKRARSKTIIAPLPRIESRSSTASRPAQAMGPGPSTIPLTNPSADDSEPTSRNIVLPDPLTAPHLTAPSLLSALNMTPDEVLEHASRVVNEPWSLQLPPHLEEELMDWTYMPPLSASDGFGSFTLS